MNQKNSQKDRIILNLTEDCLKGVNLEDRRCISVIGMGNCGYTLLSSMQKSFPELFLSTFISKDIPSKMDILIVIADPTEIDSYEMFPQMLEATTNRQPPFTIGAFIVKPRLNIYSERLSLVRKQVDTSFTIYNARPNTEDISQIEEEAILLETQERLHRLLKGISLLFGRNNIIGMDFAYTISMLRKVNAYFGAGYSSNDQFMGAIEEAIADIWKHYPASELRQTQCVISLISSSCLEISQLNTVVDFVEREIAKYFDHNIDFLWTFEYNENLIGTRFFLLELENEKYKF